MPCGALSITTTASTSLALVCEDVDVVWIDQIIDCPAVEVILAEAGIHHFLCTLDRPGSIAHQDVLKPDVLVIAGVVALVEFVAGTKFGADGMP